MSDLDANQYKAETNPSQSIWKGANPYLYILSVVSIDIDLSGDNVNKDPMWIIRGDYHLLYPDTSSMTSCLKLIRALNGPKIIDLPAKC